MIGNNHIIYAMTNDILWPVLRRWKKMEESLQGTFYKTSFLYFRFTHMPVKVIYLLLAIF
jgi:hypothetical protein